MVHRMSQPTTISFLPRHLEYTREEHEAKIAEYRAWLDQHGRYGQLYMVHIGRKGLLGTGDPDIVGLDIYDYSIAVLFKLNFEV
jgi:hypothetical protein